MRRAFFVFAGTVLVVGCSLFVSLDGLGPTGADAQVDDAAMESMMPDAKMPDVRQPSCPSGRGPSMVQFGDHCIDSTETTYRQYLDFVTDVADGGAQLPPECAFKTSFAPGGTLPNNLDMPVAEVDWCDAWAYCKWANKEMCGAIDGGAVGFGDFADPTKSLWTAACTKGGALTYPYGNAFDPTACNIGDPDGGGSMAVGGTFTKCNGGYPGIFDMVGNAKEWENACNGDAGAADSCRRRGGGFTSGGSAKASCSLGEPDGRDYRSSSSGIRCCSPLK
jgi:formylglycine-generating enzyme required for sulfatase activity